MREENVWGVAVTLSVFFLFAFSAVILTAGSGEKELSGPVVAQAGHVAKQNEPAEYSSQVVSEGEYQTFQATAYSISGTTFSGVKVVEGIVAADPMVLPIGSVIEVRSNGYSGIYTVLDTGAVIQGRIIDIYVREYQKALQFGRRWVKVRVLRRGWTHSAELKNLPAG